MSNKEKVQESTLIESAKAVLEWYDRDGSVGGCDQAIEDLRRAIEGCSDETCKGTSEVSSANPGRRFVVIIEKELESFWAMDELFEEFGGNTPEFQASAIEILLEDLPAIIDDASICVKVVPDAGKCDA